MTTIDAAFLDRLAGIRERATASTEGEYMTIPRIRIATTCPATDGQVSVVLNEDLDALEARLRAIEALAKRYREALIAITGMGRVCEDFELCTHPACMDSCGAFLEASVALAGEPGMEG